MVTIRILGSINPNRNSNSSYILNPNHTMTLTHGRATSGPRARSGPRRSSVRPATLLGNNIPIRPAKHQPLWGHRTHLAHTQDALHRSPGGSVRQVCQPHGHHVCCVEGRKSSILSRGLNHRQFQALVDEVDVQYGVLLYFCEVRWLSWVAMLFRACDLQKEIATFLRQKNLPYADQFFDPRWLARLALLTDITTHMNALIVQL